MKLKLARRLGKLCNARPAHDGPAAAGLGGALVARRLLDALVHAQGRNLKRKSKFEKAAYHSLEGRELTLQANESLKAVVHGSLASLATTTKPGAVSPGSTQGQPGELRSTCTSLLWQGVVNFVNAAT
jgi:hypothetical protein